MVTILTIWRLTITASMIACSVLARGADGSEVISEVIPLRYSQASDVAALLKQSTPKVARDIIADIRSNSLLVFGSKEQIETVKRKILTADVPLPQILIEAAVLELELPNSRKAGVQHLTDKSLTTIDRFLGSSICWFTNLVRVTPTNDAGGELGEFTYVAGLGNGFNTAIAALVDEHQVKVIQKPRIQTSSGAAAKLFIGQTTPYVGRSVSYSGSYCGCTHYDATHEVGLGLEMIPEIVPDGTITVAIKTTYDSVPNTTTTSAAVSVTVHNGDMLLIGGAIHNRKRRFPPTTSRGALLDRSSQPLRIEQVILLRFAVLPPSSDHRFGIK
jgi:type II secretory pathway component GspD/PulD (secretin)